ncbi:hypothetical protein Dimus_015937 [Dionaea muscipula]
MDKVTDCKESRCPGLLHSPQTSAIHCLLPDEAMQGGFCYKRLIHLLHVCCKEKYSTSVKKELPKSAPIRLHSEKTVAAADNEHELQQRLLQGDAISSFQACT